MRRKSRKSTHWKRSGLAKTPSGTFSPLRSASFWISAGGAVPSRWTCSSASGERHTRPSSTRRSAGGSSATLDRRAQRGRGLVGARVAAGVDDRQRAVRADLGADRRDPAEPDAVVDLVVLAPAVAAEAGDDEADGAGVDADHVAGALGRDRLGHARVRQVRAGALEQVGRAAEGGDHRARSARRRCRRRASPGRRRARSPRRAAGAPGPARPRPARASPRAGAARARRRSGGRSTRAPRARCPRSCRAPRPCR